MFVSRSMNKLTQEKLDIIIGLLESTLGNDMSSGDADNIVEMCVALLKGKKPPENNKAKAMYWICQMKDMRAGF